MKSIMEFNYLPTEDSRYFKEYLTEQGSKWKFSYLLQNNEGTLIETEKKNSFPFTIKYNKLTFMDPEGQERFESLNETERRWVENCFSEILFLRKK